MWAIIGAHWGLHIVLLWYGENKVLFLWGESELSRLEMESPEILDCTRYLCKGCVRHQWEQETWAPAFQNARLLCSSHPLEIPCWVRTLNISNNAWHGRTGAPRSFAGVGMLITGPERLWQSAEESWQGPSTEQQWQVPWPASQARKKSRFNIIFRGSIGFWEALRKIPWMVSFFIDISKRSYAVGNVLGKNHEQKSGWALPHPTDADLLHHKSYSKIC